MEYTRLQNLSNKYPNTLNYKQNGAGNVSLYGVYPEKNKLDFKIPSLEELNFVPGTNFRFILAIFKTWTDTTPKYYTSDAYYKDLEASVIESNPYFLQNSFINDNMVSYVCEDSLQIYKDLKPLENKNFINVRQNLFVKGVSEIDYDNLVTYIDWFVDKVSPLDDENFGVIKPEFIAGWDILDGNYVTGEVKTTVSASFGIGSTNFINETSGNNELDIANKNLKVAEEKRDKIINKINLIQTAIKTEAGFTIDRGLISSARVKIDEETYVGSAKLTNSQKRESLKSSLRNVLNDLNRDKTAAETAVTSAQSIVSDVKNKIGDVKAKADALKGKAQDLLGKIPKIPKLPKIPKIPKLPKIADLKALLPALPLLPVLPKLPSLPKIPSLKFPPLPKFKPKKPKEPKKFKKGKGMKGALDSAKAAAASAKGAVASAGAAAASATASVKNAANSAQSAVANAQSAIASAQSTVQNAVQSTVGSVQNAVSNAQSEVSSKISNIQNATNEAINNIPKL